MMNVKSYFGILMLLLPVTLADDAANKLASNNKMQNGACFDLYGTNKCEELRDVWHFCKLANENRMNEMCRKTCGLCRPKINCKTSKYGCCEEGMAAKVDIHGSNCPECKDKHSDLCQAFVKDCNDLGWAGQWMQANCRKTCQFCKAKKKPVCKDSIEKEFCMFLRDHQSCKTNPLKMKELCTKTCGFCGDEGNNEAKDGVQPDVEKGTAELH